MLLHGIRSSPRIWFCPQNTNQKRFSVQPTTCIVKHHFEKGQKLCTKMHKRKNLKNRTKAYKNVYCLQLIHLQAVQLVKIRTFTKVYIINFSFSRLSNSFWQIFCNFSKPCERIFLNLLLCETKDYPTFVSTVKLQ